MINTHKHNVFVCMWGGWWWYIFFAFWFTLKTKNVNIKIIKLLWTKIIHRGGVCVCVFTFWWCYFLYLKGYNFFGCCYYDDDSVMNSFKLIYFFVYRKFLAVYKLDKQIHSFPQSIAPVACYRLFIDYFRTSFFYRLHSLHIFFHYFYTRVSVIIMMLMLMMIYVIEICFDISCLNIDWSKRKRFPCCFFSLFHSDHHDFYWTRNDVSVWWWTNYIFSIVMDCFFSCSHCYCFG